MQTDTPRFGAASDLGPEGERAQPGLPSHGAGLLQKLLLGR